MFLCFYDFKGIFFKGHHFLKFVGGIEPSCFASRISSLSHLPPSVLHIVEPFPHLKQSRHLLAFAVVIFSGGGRCEFSFGGIQESLVDVGEGGGD